MAIVNDKKRHHAASQRFEILKEIERSGNVSQACLQHEVSRATYYAWQKKYKANGLSGIQQKARTSKSPDKIRQRMTDRVVELALQHPEFGCASIAGLLAQEGISLSPPTVQKILNQNGLGTVSRRLFRLEKLHVLEGFPVTDRQLELIIRNDPCLKERNNTGTYPGEILVQECFPIFQLIPSCYIHVVIDTYSSLAFVYPWFEKSSAIAAEVLQLLALGRFKSSEFPVKRVLTNSAYIYTRLGKNYSDCCMRRNIRHEIYTGKDRNWNGHIERFKKFFVYKYRHLKTQKADAAELTELFRIMKSTTLNSKTRVNGFPNFGMTPSDRIALFRASISNVEQNTTQ